MWPRLQKALACWQRGARARIHTDAAENPTYRLCSINESVALGSTFDNISERRVKPNTTGRSNM